MNLSRPAYRSTVETAPPPGRTFWLLALVIAVVPLPLGANRPAAWSLLELAVGALLVMWSLSALRHPDRVAVPWRRHWPATLAFALLILWLWLQSTALTPASWHAPVWAEAARVLHQPLAGAIGVTPEAAIVGIARLLAYGGVFWLALHYGRTERQARLLLWVLVGAATAYAVYGLIAMTAGNTTILWFAKWAYPHSLTATFVNRNNFATYAGLAILAAVALLKRRLRHGAGRRYFPFYRPWPL